MSSKSTSGTTATSRRERAGAASNGRPEYARKLSQVENLLWETAERLGELTHADQWPPPGKQLCQMAAVLVRIAVTIDVLGHEAGSRAGKTTSSRNGKPSPSES